MPYVYLIGFGFFEIFQQKSNCPGSMMLTLSVVCKAKPVPFLCSYDVHCPQEAKLTLAPGQELFVFCRTQ